MSSDMLKKHLLESRWETDTPLQPEKIVGRKTVLVVPYRSF